MSSASVSYIDDLKDTEEYKEDKEECKEDIKDIESIRKGCVNLFLPLETRLHYLYLYYISQKDEIVELISSIIGMYFFSKTKNLTEYLCAIASCKNIPTIYRIECAKNLEDGEGFSLLNDLFDKEKVTILELPTPIRISSILFLMNSDLFMNETLGYFCEILSDQKLDCLYRYKTIQTLESKFDYKNNKKRTEDETQKLKDKFMFYAKESTLRFMKNSENNFTYRVLAGQYLYEKCEIDQVITNDIETFLLEIASDRNVKEDIRADACDILLQYGTEDSRKNARNLLFTIGGGDFSRNNIFKNSQNVHIRSIETSVQTILEKLIVYYPHNSGKIYDFITTRDDIYDTISKNNTNKEDRESIEGSLTRVLIDRAVYGSTNMTLTTILAKVWTYIQDSEHKTELEKRLLEELIESNNKCSTGYTSRLVNTLSGFDDNMSISISFEDQIISNLEGRLNAKIREMSDDNEVDLILEEMTIPVIDYARRSHFLKFFREVISSIREGMYTEFCKFMSDLDYDMYFRKAIIHYEGCS